MSDTLIIKNKKIVDFYTKNNINFEAVNLIFLDLIEKINNDMSSTIVNTIHNEILDSVRDIKNSVSSFNNTLIVKMHEINREYTDNLKLILSNSSNENVEKIGQFVEKNTESFLRKVTEEMPKSFSSGIKENLMQMEKTIKEDIKVLKNDENTIKEYISTLDTKLQNIQQPIYSFINASQEQINTNITGLKESLSQTKVSQEKVMDDLGDFLNKYKTNSNYKGKYSEHMMEQVLNKMFPCDEVINSSSSLKNAGDFIVKREGKVPLLIENKNYELSVQKEGVEKFLRDIRVQKCNGIFLSQFSGIQYKPNYFIEIEDNCVLVYLHNVDYSEEKIRTAVDIIDNLSGRLFELSMEGNMDGIPIRKDVLDKINAEYCNFINQKELLQNSLKDFQKSFTTQIDGLKMPDLAEYLNGKYASLHNQKWVCDICGDSFLKKTGLASHKKKHNKGGGGEEGEVKNEIKK